MCCWLECLVGGPLTARGFGAFARQLAVWGPPTKHSSQQRISGQLLFYHDKHEKSQSNHVILKPNYPQLNRYRQLHVNASFLREDVAMHIRAGASIRFTSTSTGDMHEYEYLIFTRVRVQVLMHEYKYLPMIYSEIKRKDNFSWVIQLIFR